MSDIASCHIHNHISIVHISIVYVYIYCVYIYMVYIYMVYIYVVYIYMVYIYMLYIYSVCIYILCMYIYSVYTSICSRFSFAIHVFFTFPLDPLKKHTPFQAAGRCPCSSWMRCVGNSVGETDGVLGERLGETKPVFTL